MARAWEKTHMANYCPFSVTKSPTTLLFAFKQKDVQLCFSRELLHVLVLSLLVCLVWCLRTADANDH